MRIKSALAAVAVCASCLVLGSIGGATADEVFVPNDSVGSPQIVDRSVQRKDINFHFAGKYRTERALERLRTRVRQLEIEVRSHHG